MVSYGEGAASRDIGRCNWRRMKADATVAVKGPAPPAYMNDLDLTVVFTTRRVRNAVDATRRGGKGSAKRGGVLDGRVRRASRRRGAR